MKSSFGSKYFTLYAFKYWAIAALLYTTLIFILPANKATMATYDLTSLQYRFTLLLVVIPSFLVWFAAFMGYAALRDYSKTIKGTPEGQPFATIADGITWLAWSLPVTSFCSILVNAWANSHQNQLHAAIIITNYISVILPLIAFLYIFKGVRSLVLPAGYSLRVGSMPWTTGIFSLVGAVYVYLVLSHFDGGAITSSDNPYFLPLWLMLGSIVIPYLLIWFMGIASSFALFKYSGALTGVIYRRAVFYIAIGFGAVIISSVAMQYVNTVIPRVGHLTIDYRLYINIMLRTVAGIGFICLAIGAKKLKRIEEV